MLRYYAMIDMTKMTVLDALASSYLEAKCDEFENERFRSTYSFLVMVVYY